MNKNNIVHVPPSDRKSRVAFYKINCLLKKITGNYTGVHWRFTLPSLICFLFYKYTGWQGSKKDTQKVLQLKSYRNNNRCSRDRLNDKDGWHAKCSPAYLVVFEPLHLHNSCPLSSAHFCFAPFPFLIQGEEGGESAEAGGWKGMLPGRSIREKGAWLGKNGRLQDKIISPISYFPHPIACSHAKTGCAACYGCRRELGTLEGEGNIFLTPL